MTRDDMLTLCMSHMHRYVGVHTADGAFHDGIVEKVDETHLYLAVPVGCEREDDNRAFFGGPLWGGYGFGYPYGYGFWPRRRFFRRVLPLAALLALSLLPYY